jgi:hypothetical protein
MKMVSMGRRVAGWFLLFCLVGQAEYPTFAASGAPVPPADFANPPPTSRILKIIHSWPDEPTAQDSLIQKLATQGFGGVVCNVSFKDYLVSDAKWKAFERAVKEAKKAGFALWLYDEKGYPSGTAGGIVLRDHPEWEARGLLIADVEGEAAPLTLEVPPGQPFLIAAFPVRDGEIELKAMINLAAQVQGGKLSWQPPSGRWRVMAITEGRLFEGTHASMSLSEHIPYPNLLQPEPIAQFLEITHQAYAQHLGNNLGRWFVSTFTDEPSLMSLFLRRMPYRVLPWSPSLPVEFKKRRGYALEPVVPALVADAGPAGRRARYDYWRTVGELVSDSYFGQIQRWCARHQVLSGGHLLMEENLVNQVPLYGDFFRCLRRLDAPSIDCLTSIPDQVPWHIARLAGSAADLENRSVTMCETSDHSQRYRPPGDTRPVRNVTAEEIRGTCNRLIVEGIDVITSYYSFAGLSDEQLRHLNAWVGRCCSALKGGHQVADIAVLYPVESVWPRFIPSRHYANDSPTAAQIETIYHDVSDALYGAGRDFTYVDGRVLAEAKVEGAALVHGKLRWRVVVLPSADTLPLRAWETLARFAQHGGVVIAVGARPANSEAEFPDRRVLKLAGKMFGPDTPDLRATANARDGGGILLPASASGLLPQILNRILEPDVKVSAARAPLRCTHRRIGGREVYLVINDSDLPWSGPVSFAAAGPGEQCDPATGEITPCVAGTDLTLSAYGGAVFRFPTQRLPKLSRLTDAALPPLDVRALPAASPVLGRGEFVREELAAPELAKAPPQPAWRIKATLTKGGVDTFLFAQFPYPQTLDLQGADFLVLDTWVPPGQRTPNQLLVILHEKDGADYLANTGRLLGVSGHSRTWLPLSRFQLAGWSHDQNGHLDLSDITELRVGWGGYIGAEGEKVEFSLALPQTAVVKQSSRN